MSEKLVSAVTPRPRRDFRLIWILVAAGLFALWYRTELIVSDLGRFNPSVNKQLPRAKTLPVLVWHGLGDSFQGTFVEFITSALKEHWPGENLNIYSIRLANNMVLDTAASINGDSLEQLKTVCQDTKVYLNSINHYLSEGVHGIGLSQGGLFIRGLAQICPELNFRRLITIGSPHQGFWKLPPRACENPFLKYLCSVIEGKAIYSDFLQKSLVPASYFRNPLRLDEFKNSSSLLAKLNNESSEPLKLHSLENLEALALVMHNNDTILYPKESAWFASSNGSNLSLIPFNRTDQYNDTTLGLGNLDKNGKILYFVLDSDHLMFNKYDLHRIFDAVL